MPEPLSLPLRVSVKGASTVGWSSPMGGPRTDLGFPRVVERELLSAGQSAVVLSHTIGGSPTRDVLRDWEREVVGWSPDVVIIMAGHYETIHALWPQWLERHANSLTWAPRRLGTLYRKKVLRPTWRALVKLQGRVDARMPAGFRRRRVANAVADIGRAVSHIRGIASPLVIVMESPQAGSHGTALFPGIQARLDLLNAGLARMVEQADSEDVRLFRTTELVSSYADGDLDLAVPDGFHFAPGLHDLVGRRLAEQVLAWASTQEHLKPR